jgi:zinc protease
MGLLSPRPAVAALVGVALFALASLTPSAAIRPNKIEYQSRRSPTAHRRPVRGSLDADCERQIWYHVGSKNEKAGRTGFAHLFEHLMFKGSKTSNPKDTHR